MVEPIDTDALRVKALAYVADPISVDLTDAADEIDRLRAALVHREKWSGSACMCDEEVCPVEDVEWHPAAVSPKEDEQ